MLSPLTPDEVQSLDLPALVRRMDEVRTHAELERYGDFAKAREAHFPLVAQLMATATIASFPDDRKRRIAHCAFRFLLQMDLVSVSAGISNREIFGPSYNEGLWTSPAFWMRAAVLNQYTIIGSRIALECFFDLLYLIDRGTLMPAKNSKFATFRKWVLQEGNPFIYFVGHIVHAFEFDRSHRQPEIHGTSAYASALLTLQMPSNDDLNRIVRLENNLLSVWAPLLQILSGERPTQLAGFDNDFARRYITNQAEPEEFSEFVRQLMEERMK